MSLTPLGTYENQFEAEIVAGRLRADGIEAIVFDAGLNALYAMPVRLMVLDEDVDRARALIAQPAEAEAVDRRPWSDLAD